MPIEVHCPDPACAKIHLVKNKYAGMRGKCPACGSWMFIPAVAGLPTAISPRPEGLAEAATWKQEETPAPSPSEIPARASSGAPAPQARTASKERPPARSADEEAFAEEPLALLPDRKPAPLSERPYEEEEEAPVVSPEEEEEVKPAKRFSWPAAVLLVLGMLSLGAIAATPFLAPGTIQATGVYEKTYGERKPQGITEEQKFYVMVVPGGVAFLALLSLLIGLIARQFGFLSIFLVDLVTLLSAVLLFLALFYFHKEMKDREDIMKRVEASKVEGTLEITLGQYLYAGLGGAVGALLFFTFAAVFMHRRWWSRMLTFLLLGGVAGLGAVWVFRAELGIEGLEGLRNIVPL